MNNDNNDNTDIDPAEQTNGAPAKQPEFQLGGVSRQAAEDSVDAIDAQAPVVPRQTLVIGLQDEDKEASDPSKPGKTTLVIGPEYQEEKKKKKQKPIKYATASQQAAKENKLPLWLIAIIVIGLLLLLGGVGYVVYTAFLTA